ncbi:MAG: phytoene desaturase family protein [Acidobacteriota bacterium]|nr:phytoene desaturase family protein [Acidobacteriota bacterium]
MKKIIIIGAGLGGLSAACRLAKSGFEVTVLEKNATVGGKVNFVENDGYKFDTGASLVTMKHVFEDLFKFCDREIGDYLDIKPLEPICRYFWSDRTVFDASQSVEKTLEEVEQLEPNDVKGFQQYLADSKQKYEIAERTFLAKSLNELPQLLKPKYLPDLLKISTLKTLDTHNKQYFKSEKLQQLFNRFATYNGSSPYITPATFALIPYVEFGLGAWYVKGGIYQIPKALGKLATELGVKFRVETEVEKIIIENKTAKGVRLKSGEILMSDFVITNADAIETYRNLIDKNERRIYTDKKLEKIEPSCSGFVLLLGTNKKFTQLTHHNIFFSDDYKAEFEAIFETKTPAKNPTIYICATSRTDATQAPENCENLFILINAPYTSSATNWEKEKENYRNLIIKKLEEFGLEGLEKSIEFEQIITPEDFEKKYRANKGSIYGVSSSGIFSAFMRIPNMAKDIENLYFVGGTTHPGGGMPLVLLSGKMACELILQKES